MNHVDLNPNQCAELHNQLITKLIVRIRDAGEHVRWDLISRIRECASESASLDWLEDAALVAFFSQLDC